jgi:hypothetical protein
MPTGKCRIPQYKVADNAHEKIVGEKPKPSQYDQWKYPPRVPPIEFPVPNNPRASCNSGGGQNGYFNSGFYQSDPTFSRTDGLHAAKQFCDMHRNGSILGPDGMMNNRKVEVSEKPQSSTQSGKKLMYSLTSEIIAHL